MVSGIQDSLGTPFHGAKKTVCMQQENSLTGGVGIACLGYLVLPM